jgi:hypothetical protein
MRRASGPAPEAAGKPETAAMKNPFTEHPHSIGETYLSHALAASRICVRLGFAATAAGIHAVLPFVFVTTTRRMVNKMSDEFNSGQRTPARKKRAA